MRRYDHFSSPKHGHSPFHCTLQIPFSPWKKPFLGGGFKYCLFSPLLGEDSHLDSYFSTGLVQPPTSFRKRGLLLCMMHCLRGRKSFEFQVAQLNTPMICHDLLDYYMGVSKNRGTPKSSILIGFSIINHPFRGFSPYFWKHPYLYSFKVFMLLG